eukprot:1165581-Pyramimonas_sp.AAC.1
MHRCARAGLPGDHHSWEALPEISVADLRRACASFPSMTAVGQLGLNPRSMLAVSDQCLQTVA